MWNGHSASIIIYGTVSERCAQLISRLGAFSSRVYSSDVLCKARSEVRVALRGSKDEMEELLVLHKLKPTFIRCIKIAPFSVLMWLNSQLDCYCRMVKGSGRPELYMDATGGKVKRMDGKDVYATSLVLASRQVSKPQIPVAIMLSNCHDTPSYTSFLQNWWSAVNAEKSVDLPAAVVVDMNWPSIHACVLVFFGMDIVHYLKSSMAIVNGQWTTEMLNNFTVVGLGRAHMSKMIVTWKEMKGDRLTSLWWKYAAVKLLTMVQWTEVQEYLHHLFSVLLAPTTRHIESSVEYVSSCIVRTTLHDSMWLTHDVDDTTPCPTLRSETIYSQSPFYTTGQQILRAATPTVGENAVDDDDFLHVTSNVRYNPALAEKLLKVVVAYMPLMSGIIFANQRFACNKGIAVTNATAEAFLGWRESYAEGWHNILK